MLPFGHSVSVFNLRETVEAPDLFLIDIMLPEMDGITLARRIQDEGFTSTPMIAMSASVLMRQVAEASGLFEHTLSKPFDITEFLQTIAP